MAMMGVVRQQRAGGYGGDIGTYRRSGGEVKVGRVKRILHTKEDDANEIRSWGDLLIKKYK